MLRRTNAQTDMDFLSLLPNELLYGIILFLSDKEIIQLSEASKRLNEFIKVEFFNSLYGKSFKFNKWHQMELANCQIDIRNYINTCKQIFLEQQRIMEESGIDLPQRRHYRANEQSRKIISSVFFLLTCVNFYNYQNNPSTLSLTGLLVTIALGALLYKLNTSMANAWRLEDAHADNAFRYGLAPAAVNIRTDFEALLRKYQHLFAALDGLDPRRYGNMVGHLEDFLRFNMKEIESIAIQFKVYLENTRFNNKKYLDLSKETEGLGELGVKYATNVATFWSKQNPDHAIIEPVTVERLKFD